MKQDLTAILSESILSGLGESATITPSGGGGSSRTITVIFDADHKDEFDIDSREIYIAVDASENDDLAIGDAVNVRSTDYEVVRIERDGGDLDKLFLHEV